MPNQKTNPNKELAMIHKKVAACSTSYCCSIEVKSKISDSVIGVGRVMLTGDGAGAESLIVMLDPESRKGRRVPSKPLAERVLVT